MHVACGRGSILFWRYATHYILPVLLMTLCLHRHVNKACVWLTSRAWFDAATKILKWLTEDRQGLSTIAFSVNSNNPPKKENPTAITCVLRGSRRARELSRHSRPAGGQWAALVASWDRRLRWSPAVDWHPHPPGSTPAPTSHPLNKQRPHNHSCRSSRKLKLREATAIYTVRQKKRNEFSFVCIFSNARQKRVNFFAYIKESISNDSVYLILACVKNFV